MLRILKRGAVVELTGDQADADGKVWYRLKEGGWVVSDFFKLYSTRPRRTRRLPLVRLTRGPLTWAGRPIDLPTNALLH